MSKDYNAAARTPNTAALVSTIAQLEVGDTVKATFYDKHYRTFDITGILVPASYDPTVFLVASWLVNTGTTIKSDGTEEKGKPSNFLKDLEVIETASRTLF